MDELERLISAHRKQLDTQERMSANRGWAELHPRLEKRRAAGRIHRLRWTLGIAASLVILLTTGWWYASQRAADGSGTKLVSDYAPELYLEERSYLTAIAKKREALQLERIDSTFFAPFLEELSLLDSLQRTDLEGLPQTGVNDRSLSALIHYYQIKLELLELLENELIKQSEYRRRRPDRSI